MNLSKKKQRQKKILTYLEHALGRVTTQYKETIRIDNIKWQENVGYKEKKPKKKQRQLETLLIFSYFKSQINKKLK